MTSVLKLFIAILGGRDNGPKHYFINNVIAFRKANSKERKYMIPVPIRNFNEHWYESRQ